MTLARLENTYRNVMAHDPTVCIGQFCCLHNRSDHHMRAWPQHWRADRGLMERICPHGCGHPDPDDPKAADPVDAVHGCCGCCEVPR